MSRSVLRGGRRVGGTHSDRPERLVAAVTGATVAGLGLSDGGFFTATWTWATFVFAWALAVIVYLRDSLLMSRLELAFVSTIAALASLMSLSALWGVDTTEVRHEAGRVLFYALAVLVLLLLARRESVAPILGGVLAGMLVVIGVGLAHYLLRYGSRPPHAFEGYLLFWPVGYANALGVLAAIGIVLNVGLATHGSRRLRPALLVVLVPFASALYLSGSYGAGISLALGLGVLLLLDRRRSWRVVGLSGVACASAMWLSSSAGLNSGQPRFDSEAARTLGLELLLLACAVAVCALVLLPPLGSESRVDRRLTRFGLPAAATLGLLAIVAAFGTVDAVPRVSWRTRADYWEVAWEQWKANPLLGAGTGSFGDYWRGAATGLGARDAHNLYLETLAELGPLGLTLLLSLLLVPLVAARRARHDPLVPTAVGAYAVFVFHAGIDWDWELPVVALSGLFCAAALLVAGRERDGAATLATRPWVLVAAVVIVVIASVELVANGAVHGW